MAGWRQRKHYQFNRLVFGGLFLAVTVFTIAIFFHLKKKGLKDDPPDLQKKATLIT